MRAIAISGKGRSGKTTLANELKNIFEKSGVRAIVVNYADYLKMICEKYFGWDGQKDEAGRQLLQQTGDLVRKNNPDCFVNVVLQLVEGLQGKVDVILVGDCRFWNEISLLKSSMYLDGVFTIRVEREGDYSDLTEEQKRHPSETSLDDYKFDLVVKNDKDLQSFLDKAVNAVKWYNFSQRKETPVI